MLNLIFIAAILLPLSHSKMEDVYFAPSVFLNHGGGPYPVLREKYNIEIGDSLKNVSNYVDLGRLKAIIIVTAHREEDVVTISSGERHPLLYDYYNFPSESYEFKYDAPGDPVLAAKIHDAFKNAGIQSALDDKRGWDHGVFIPMMLINPKADIPIIQISILNNQNASQHYDIGKVLYEFRKEGIAIFGSGLSYHNMNEFTKARTEIEKKIANEEFDNFLNEVCTGDEENRKKIIFWDQQKGGLDSHPLGEADHLMPLIVNAGAGGTRPGKKIFESVFLGKFKLSGFLWDGDPVLATKIHDAFKNAGIQSALDDKRGWDHGVFIPMMLINPKADIPIIQISILKNQNAAQHYDIGKVLYEFRKEGIAIFGSGLSYHNMKEFTKARTEIEKQIANEEFDHFLNGVCTGDVENRKKIIFWDQQKGGLDSHPLGEADHLMPLIVNAGAGGTRPGKKMFESVFLGKFKLSGFLWDGE